MPENLPSLLSPHDQTSWPLTVPLVVPCSQRRRNKAVAVPLWDRCCTPLGQVAPRHTSRRVARRSARAYNLTFSSIIDTSSCSFSRFTYPHFATCRYQQQRRYATSILKMQSQSRRSDGRSSWRDSRSFTAGKLSSLLAVLDA